MLLTNVFVMIIIKNIFGKDVKKITGCGSAWLERLVWDQEVAGSSPASATIKSTENNLLSVLFLCFLTPKVRSFKTPIFAVAL